MRRNKLGGHYKTEQMFDLQKAVVEDDDNEDENAEPDKGWQFSHYSVLHECKT